VAGFHQVRMEIGMTKKLILEIAKIIEPGFFNQDHDPEIDRAAMERAKATAMAKAEQIVALVKSTIVPA
jgi:hypothetical protein